MRSTAFALSSLLIAACATSPTDDPASGGGGGGKADDSTAGCPVDAGAEAVEAAIAGGGSCYVAAGLAEACAYGSSLDVQFVAAATEVCAAGFDAMSAAARADHDALVARCWAKYENEEGTLYRAMAAHCTLEVTRLFNTLYPEPETSDPVVAYSESCPVDASDADKIASAIDAAEYCGSAADIASACAWGSSIDVSFAADAAAKCTAPASTDDQALSDRLHALCASQLADEGGTLGQAIRAHCSLQVAVALDSVLSPVEN